jgi:hypothetical protein
MAAWWLTRATPRAMQRHSSMTLWWRSLPPLTHHPLSALSLPLLPSLQFRPPTPHPPNPTPTPSPSHNQQLNHSAIQPLSHITVELSHTGAQAMSHPATQPPMHSPIQPLSHEATQPFSNITIQPTAPFTASGMHLRLSLPSPSPSSRHSSVHSLCLGLRFIPPLLAIHTQSPFYRHRHRHTQQHTDTQTQH